MEEQKDARKKVLEHQLAIAKSMKVDEDTIEVLAKVEEWQIREMLYVCALDGMGTDQIKKLAEDKASVLQIKKAQLDFYMEKCVQTDPLQRNLESLEQEVKRVCKESRDVRNSIEAGLDEALKKQAAAQEEAIRSKDQVIEILQSQMKELQCRNQALQDAMGGQAHGKDAVRGYQELPAAREEASFPDSGTEDSRHSVSEGQGTGSGREEDDGSVREKTGHGIRGLWPADRIKGIFCSHKKKAYTSRFVERYLKDGNLSEEQKDYLLECLEEGVPLDVIEKIAVPGIPVETMERLRRLQGAT